MTIFNSFLTPPFYDSSSMEVSFFIFSWWADKDCQITNNRNDKVFVLSRVHLLNCLVTAPVSFPGVAMVIKEYIRSLSTMIPEAILRPRSKWRRTPDTKSQPNKLENFVSKYCRELKFFLLKDWLCAMLKNLVPSEVKPPIFNHGSWGYFAYDLIHLKPNLFKFATAKEDLAISFLKNQIQQFTTF